MKNNLTGALCVVLAVVLAAGAVCLGAYRGWSGERSQVLETLNREGDMAQALQSRAMDAANLAVVASRHVKEGDESAEAVSALREAYAIITGGSADAAAMARADASISAAAAHLAFLLPEEGLIDSDARERLTALKKHAGLGAGFNIALRDLEIRGAGNLLGSEQSGHIAAVGFSLYCQLLQRTVARMRGEAVPDIVDVTINLDFLDFSPGTADPDAGACLPYDYVEEDAQRMAFHRRLAETTTLGAVRKLRAELADRYGKLPRAALRLIKLAEFRVLCAQQHVSRLDVRNGRAVFYRQGSHDVAFVGRVSGTTPERKISALFHILAEHEDD